MALTVTHQFVSAVPDEDNDDIVKPSDWNAAHAITGILPPSQGGTGVANNNASTIAITGAYALGITLTGVTSVTFPTSGTLATTTDLSTGLAAKANLAGGNSFSGSQLFNGTGLVYNDAPPIEVYTDDAGVSAAYVSCTGYVGTGSNAYTGGVLHGRVAGGTKASPTQAKAGWLISGFGGIPYATTVGWLPSSPAALHHIAAEDQASGANGAYTNFYTTPIGAAYSARKQFITFTQDQTLWVKDTSLTFNNLSTSQTKPLGNIFIMTSGASPSMATVAYGSGTVTGYRVMTAGGTPASPTGTPAGAQLGFLGGYGYANDTAAWTLGSAALIQFRSAEAGVFTSTANGTYIALETTSVGSAYTSRTERMRIADGVTITTAQALGFTVGRQGSTNPVLQVDASTASVVTGAKLKGAASGGGFAFSVISSAANENLTIDALGSGGVTINGTATGTVALGQNTTVAGTATVTSSNASALAVGRQGATNPALQVDASTSSCVTGLKIKAAALAAGLALSVITSGTNEPLTIDSAGSGPISLGITSTGDIRLARNTNISITAPTIAADALLTLNGNTVATASAPPSATYLHMIGADGVTNRFWMDTAAQVNFITARTSGGTVASPSATTADQAILGFGATGYTDSLQTATKAFFRMHAKTLWSATNSDTYIVMYTTPTGSTTAAEALRVHSSGGLSVGTTTDPGIGAFLANTSIKSKGATAGIGYDTGAGSTVTQNTNKSTGVTINNVCGKITMNNATLNAGAEVGFTVTNSAVASTDVIEVNIASGASADSYQTQVDAVGPGSFRISVTNVSASNLGEAIVLNFAVLKAVSA